MTTQVALAAWEPLSPVGAADPPVGRDTLLGVKMTSQGKLIWFELYTTSLDISAEFYQEVLGWHFVPFEEYDKSNYYLIRDGNGDSVSGGLVHWDATPELTSARGNTGSGNAVIYLKVNSFSRKRETVLAKNGRIVSEAKKIGTADGYFMLIEDPEGNIVGLWSENS